MNARQTTSPSAVLLIALVLTVGLALLPVARLAQAGPLDISGIQLWLDGSDPDGDGNVEAELEDGISGATVTWADKSLLGRHFTQSTAVRQPVYSPAGFANSKGAWDFTGANGTDANGDYLLYTGAGPVPVGDDDYTYVAVWKADLTNQFRYVYSQGDGAGNGERGCIILSNTTYGFNGFNADANGFVPYTANQTNLTVLQIDTQSRFGLGGTNPNVRIYDEGNRFTATTGNPGNLSIQQGLTIVGSSVGTAEFFDGMIAELIVYDKVLSNVEINSINGYLSTKYGVTTTVLPVDYTSAASADWSLATTWTPTGVGPPLAIDNALLQGGHQISYDAAAVGAVNQVTITGTDSKLTLARGLTATTAVTVASAGALDLGGRVLTVGTLTLNAGSLARTGGGTFAAANLAVQGGTALSLAVGDSVTGNLTVSDAGSKLTLADNLSNTATTVAALGALDLNGKTMTSTTLTIDNGTIARTNGGGLAPTNLTLRGGVQYTPDAADTAPTGTLIVNGAGSKYTLTSNVVNTATTVEAGGTVDLNGKALASTTLTIDASTIARTGGGGLAPTNLTLKGGVQYTPDAADSAVTGTLIINGAGSKYTQVDSLSVTATSVEAGGELALNTKNLTSTTLTLNNGLLTRTTENVAVGTLNVQGGTQFATIVGDTVSTAINISSGTATGSKVTLGEDLTVSGAITVNGSGNAALLNTLDIGTYKLTAGTLNFLQGAHFNRVMGPLPDDPHGEIHVGTFYSYYPWPPNDTTRQNIVLHPKDTIDNLDLRKGNGGMTFTTTATSNITTSVDLHNDGGVIELKLGADLVLTAHLASREAKISDKGYNVTAELFKNETHLYGGTVPEPNNGGDVVREGGIWTIGTVYFGRGGTKLPFRPGDRVLTRLESYQQRSTCYDFLMYQDPTVFTFGTGTKQYDVTKGLTVENENSSGLSLQRVSATNQGDLTLKFDADTTGNVLDWGFRWKGDHVADLQTLHDNGQIILDLTLTTGLTFDKAQNIWYSPGDNYTYVGFNAPNEWNNAAGGDWGEWTNWKSNAVPNGIGAMAIFANVIGAANREVQLNTDRTAGKLTFNNATEPTLGNYTIVNGEGDPWTLTLNNGSSVAVIDVQKGNNAISTLVALGSNLEVKTAADAAMTISGNLSGDGKSLTKMDPGTLTLSGQNSYSGGTTVNGGTLRIATAGSLPPGGALTIGASGTVVLSAGLGAAGGAAASTAAAVPEPGTLALLAAGLALAALVAWRRIR